MKTRTADQETRLAAMVAGEDLRVGDNVAILNEIYELPSFLWDCDVAGLAPHDVVRIQCTARDAGTPLRVQSICLPFVFLKEPTGAHRTVDLRSVQLVRLDAGYARQVRKALRRQQSAARKAHYS